ncbi:MAG TPA: leucyl aminopeptidase family protein [Candidatus Nanopelagicaceae bacterium]|nr:leucyl aminopeptidase family protein [Candidatus Nanopelagicaceae bacterium]
MAPQLATGSVASANFALFSIPLDLNLKVPTKLRSSLEKLFDLKLSDEFAFENATGKVGEIVEFPVSAPNSKIERILVVGIGSGSVEDYRKAGAALGRRVKGRENSITNAVSFAASKQGLIAHNVSLSLATYAWSRRVKTDRVTALETIDLVVNRPDTDAEIARAQILIDSVFAARDLIQTPSDTKSPAWLAAMAHSMVEASDDGALTVRVREERELAQEGFGGLLAVGMSSPKRAPRLVEVKYAPTGSKNWPHVVLVGKGIVFDTGGVSLKRPYDTMIPMKTDMAGAATVLAACVAMSRIKPRVRITALLGCAENALSATAQRPSDVIKHYGGTTVEVINTDGEGRLILADLLAYADIKLKPDFLVDVATLTGAASLGLGRQYSAFYTRDEKLATSLMRASNLSGERAWQMPLADDYDFVLESQIADFKNADTEGIIKAGSITAALFLEKFVGDRHWAHFDIAGPARSDSDSGENPKGGTGYGVRLLIEWLASL